jgi:hypothetical protein
VKRKAKAEEVWQPDFLAVSFAPFALSYRRCASPSSQFLHRDTVQRRRGRDQTLDRQAGDPCTRHRSGDRLAIRRQPAKAAAGAGSAPDPTALLLDEPTAAVDVGAKADTSIAISNSGGAGKMAKAEPGGGPDRMGAGGCGIPASGRGHKPSVSSSRSQISLIVG